MTGRLAASVTDGPEAHGVKQVLIADDHDGYRDGVARLIDAHPRLAVVALAADGTEAYERIVDLQPDVALLDVRMPGHDGIEVCRRLREHGTAPGTAVVLITGTPDPVLSQQAGAAGAAALLGKETPPRELCERLLAASPRPA
jgi:two-component system, NarL family, nitrate/nitrite response regulator NarL